MQRSLYLCVLASLALMVGCAYSEFFVPQEEGASTSAIAMEGTEIYGVPGGVENAGGYDAEALLERGQGQFQTEQYDRAARIYLLLVEAFPDSPLVPLARYNAGLAFEQLKAWPEAVGQYQALVRHASAGDIHRDAYFRLASVQSYQQDWKGVIDAFSAILGMGGEHAAMDEIEARVGMGVGQFMLGQIAHAEETFSRAIQYYEDRSDKADLPVEYFIAQARFYLGEAASRAFESVILVRPGELTLVESTPKASANDPVWTHQVAARLETKCEHLLRAQNHFIRAIRVGHQGWATAAGYRIGAMYERLFDELIAVPVPLDLEPDVVSVYKEELRTRIGVLVRKATDIYKMNRAMAVRVGANNEWVERTEQALKRMSEVYGDIEPAEQEGSPR